MLVAGCAVGPDWQQPKVETPPAWRIEYAQAADFANARWLQAFGDPVLDNLVEDALRDNRDLVQAAARVEQFLGALRTTRAQFYPQFSYGGSAGRNRASENGPSALPAGVARDYPLSEMAPRASSQIEPLRPGRRPSQAVPAEGYSSEPGARRVASCGVARAPSA